MGCCLEQCLECGRGSRHLFRMNEERDELRTTLNARLRYFFSFTSFTSSPWRGLGRFQNRGGACRKLCFTLAAGSRVKSRLACGPNGKTC